MGLHDCVPGSLMPDGQVPDAGGLGDLPGSPTRRLG